jgi:hypothetical protein
VVQTMYTHVSKCKSGKIKKNWWGKNTSLPLQMAHLAMRLQKKILQ